MKRKFYLMLGVFLIFSSCSPTINPEDDLKQRAVDLAVAYFTIDFENMDQWMETVIDERYVEGFLQQKLIVLGDFFETRKVMSNASLISVGKIYERVNSEGDKVIIWEIVLRIDDPWYEDGPPEPYNNGIDRINIPWSEGEITTVYGSSQKHEMVWFTGLISDMDIGTIIEVLESQEWFVGKN